jgi:hypothetical protein
VGLFSLQASTLAGPNGRVVAIEALPPTFGALQDNVAHWQKEYAAQLAPIDVYNYAVSDTDATPVDMTFYPNATGWGTMASLQMENVLTGVNNLLQAL